MAIELPLEHSDDVIVGNSRAPFMPVLSIGYHPSTFLGLEATLRAMREDTASYATTRFSDAPSRSVSTSTSLFAELKVRVGR